MASATEQNPTTSGEEEPLLGRPGDVQQEEGKGIQFNLVIGEEAFSIEDVYTAWLTSVSFDRHRHRCTGWHMDCMSSL
jgi:hypothetical protein